MYFHAIKSSTVTKLDESFTKSPENFQNFRHLWRQKWDILDVFHQFFGVNVAEKCVI